MKFLKYALGIVLGLLGLLILWGLIEPYLLDVEPRTAEVPGLPAAWEGERVAQISDWQVGMWLDNEPTVRDAVERIIEERPALVLITGDFVYGPAEGSEEELETVGELLRPLSEAGLPTYAVLGNHDYGVHGQDTIPDVTLAQRVRRTLEAAGVRVLHNEAVALPPPDGDAQAAPPLYLVGIGPHEPDEDNPEAALAEVPGGAARIMMMHNPKTFETLPASVAPLAVAGHTHGGQIRVPFTPEWTWLDFAWGENVHADGWIDGYGAPGNQLYVNRGIGFSKIPLRINCPPELTLFTLRAAE